MEAILRGLTVGATSNTLGHDAIQMGGAIVLSLVALGLIAGWVGRLTSTNRLEGDGEMILRGGFLLVVYGGAALVFMAAVAWAWRSLFD